MAIGKKDHPGHPRATGPGVTKQMFLEPIPSRDPEIDELRNIIGVMRSEMKSQRLEIDSLKLKDKVINPEANEVLKETNEVATPRESVRASCSPINFADLPTVILIVHVTLICNFYLVIYSLSLTYI